MRLLPYLGYLAGVLTVISLWPQTKRVWTTKKVQDLSVRTFSMLVIAGLLWITYGILSTDWPLIATNTGMVILNGAILLARIKYS
jgi:MtN3 and saliva related transmembrane protein